MLYYNLEIVTDNKRTCIWEIWLFTMILYVVSNILDTTFARIIWYTAVSVVGYIFFLLLFLWLEVLPSLKELVSWLIRLYDSMLIKSPNMYFNNFKAREMLNHLPQIIEKLVKKHGCKSVLIKLITSICN